jgi:hypothetical protein
VWSSRDTPEGEMAVGNWLWGGAVRFIYAEFDALRLGRQKNAPTIRTVIPRTYIHAHVSRQICVKHGAGYDIYIIWSKHRICYILWYTLSGRRCGRSFGPRVHSNSMFEASMRGLNGDINRDYSMLGAAQQLYLFSKNAACLFSRATGV